MGTTLNYALRYPSGSTAPNVPVSMQNLAEDVDAQLTTLAKDPLGLLAKSELTSNTTGLTALTVLSNIATFTFKANRNYSIKWNGGIYCTTTGNVDGLIQIQSCATTDSSTATTGLTEMMGFNVHPQNVNQTVRYSAERVIKYTVDTTLQIKGTFNPSGGGTWTNSAGATFPNQLTITDLGTNF